MNDPALLQEALVELARARDSARVQRELLDRLSRAARDVIHAASKEACWAGVIDNLVGLIDFDGAALFPAAPVDTDIPLYVSNELLASIQWSHIADLPNDPGAPAILAIDLTPQASHDEGADWEGPAEVCSLVCVGASHDATARSPMLVLASKNIGAFNRRTIEILQRFVALLTPTLAIGAGRAEPARAVPIPWIRFNDDFLLLAANEMGDAFINRWASPHGHVLPETLSAALADGKQLTPRRVDLRAGNQFFSCDITRESDGSWTLVATDITTLRKKWRGLENSQRRLRYVLNALSVAVLVEAPDGAPLLSNPAYQKLFDHPLLSNALRSDTNEAIADIEARLVCDPADLVAMRTRREPSNKPRQSLFEAKQAGSLLLSVSTVFSADREVYRVWQYTSIPATVLNNSSHEELGSLCQLIELSQEPTMLCDSAGSIIELNTSAAALLGTSRADLRRTLLRSIFPLPYHAALSKAQQRAMAGEVAKFQAPISRSESTSAQVEVQIGALEFATQQAFAITFRDRSGLRSEDHRLELLSSVTENFGVGVAIADLHGRVEWVNKAFQTSTGYSRAETTGMTLGQLLGGPSADQEQLAQLDTHIRDGRAMQAEFLCQRASGPMFWNSVHLSPVRDAAGDVSRFIAVLSDISVRKTNEAEMLRSQQEAEQASKSKSEFLAVMSHEIRTPLNAILGLTELALQGSLPTEQRSLLRSVQANSEILTSILRDVLDFSKIEARQTTTVHEPFSLLEVTESVADALSVHAEAKGLDLVCYCDPKIPPVLRGDADHLRQVLINLIGNAIKFTDQGDILLETTLQRSTQEEAVVQIVVEDTGVGIPKAQTQNVFEQFVQADQSTRRQFGGTGLGLSITRSLVELMGGSIGVESAVGEGSQFTIDLSLPVVTSTSAPRKNHAAFSHVKAILCDPNARSRHAVERLLTHWGVEATPSDALETVAEAISGATGADVLLVDFSMYQAHQMRSARRRSTPAPVPKCQVMVLCRSSDLEPRLFEDPAAMYITKPIRQENLRLSLAQALRLEQLTTATEEHRPTNGDQHKPAHRVLLIEDNLDNRKLTSAMLEKHGMLVEAFENGADAIEAFSNSEYDVILTDLEMPGMDGVQVAQKIRALEKRLHTKKTPIVAVTAHALVSFQERCLAAGMDAFVTKPVRWPELFMKLDELLASRPKILIVDDASDALAIAKKLLNAEGEYDIDTVQSGHGAIRLIKAQRYDLVLLDMLMPDLDGAETITQIKAHRTDLSVLAMTGLDRSELAQRSTLFDGQIQKPLQREEFIETVKQHLRHGRARQESPASATGEPQRKEQPADKQHVVAIDPDILKLIPSFLKSRSKDVTTLRESLGSGDLEVARRIGHTLKGVGASYGFPAITVFGQKIERAVLDGRLKEAREQINQLEAYLESVVVHPAD